MKCLRKIICMFLIMNSLSFRVRAETEETVILSEETPVMENQNSDNTDQESQDKEESSNASDKESDDILAGSAEITEVQEEISESEIIYSESEDELKNEESSVSEENTSEELIEMAEKQDNTASQEDPAIAEESATVASEITAESENSEGRTVENEFTEQEKDAASEKEEGIVSSELSESMETAEEVFEKENETFFADGDYLAVFDVTASPYSANGNDSSVDRGINDAIYAASKLSNPEGKEILILVPDGNYYIDDSLMIFSHMTLQLGSNATITAVNPSFPLLHTAHYNGTELCGSSTCTHGGYSQFTDVKITGGTWNGNGKGNETKDLANIFNISHGQNLTIRDTVLKNNIGLHMIVLDAVKNATVENVTFIDQLGYQGSNSSYEYFMSLKNYSPSFTEKDWHTIAQGKEALHLDYANAEGSKSYPLDNTVPQGITVKNCTFRNVMGGFGAHHTIPGLSISDITASGNTFTDIKGSVIDAYQMNNISITGNTAVNVGEFVTAEESNITLNGNSVSQAEYILHTIKTSLTADNESYKIQNDLNLEYQAVVAVGQSSVSLSNCVIENAVYGGVWCSQQSNINVENTKIEKAGGERGVVQMFDGSYGSVINSTLSGTYGIYLNNCKSSNDLRFQGNTITSCKEKGIFIWNSNNVSVTSNTVTGSGAGVDIEIGGSDKVTCTGNRVTDDPDESIIIMSSTNVTQNNNSKASAQGGWIKSGTQWYYYVNGTAQKGWQSIKGTWYFFNSTGVMQTGWQKIGGIWYYFDGSGAMKTSWQKIGGTWYYFNSSGAMQTGWQKIGGIWYYFNGGGAMKTGWQKIGGIWYYFDGSGAMKTSWQKIGGTWYYFNSSGAMQTGWQKIGGTWYYFDGSGSMKTGWLKSGSYWYYFESSGAMKTGWKLISGTWYYFNSDGSMATGQKTIGGKVYNFNSSGACMNP